MRIAMEQSSQDASRRVELGHIHARLLKGMTTAEKWVDGLLESDEQREGLLKQVGADGAALVSRVGSCFHQHC